LASSVRSIINAVFESSATRIFLRIGVGFLSLNVVLLNVFL
jgi:hypothetical protein